MHLLMLGPLSVVDAAGNERPVAARRQRVLLAALAVRANRIVPIDELAELVWDGNPPPQAARTLRVYTARLRQVLGGDAAAHLLTRDPGYEWQAQVTELDLLEFEDLCRRGAQAVSVQEWSRATQLLTAALKLWRGAPLVDVQSDLVRSAEVPRLELLRLEAFEGRIAADLHQGRHEQLIPELRGLAARHSLREHLHAQLMEALAACGRRSEALAVYDQIGGRLAAELGVEPGTELRYVRRQILATRSAATGAAVPRQLAAAVAYFAGRTQELAALTGLVPEASHGGALPIAVISGTAGVGKTALALHWAHRHADLFPEGQLFANLRGFAPDGPPVPVAVVVRRFLVALAPDTPVPTSLDAQLDLYRSTLAGRRVLIVLDNVRDAEQVRPLLPGSAGCMVVVTSRYRLSGLVVVDGAVPVVLDLFTSAESDALFVARLGADRVESELPAVRELAECCGRLPLAMNIVAAKATLQRARPLRAMAEELRVGRRLTILADADPVADPTAVFSWSYKALSDSAARLFRMLGVHPGPDLALPAAASVAGTSVAGARAAIAELTRAHMLTEHVPGRYTCHDLLRGYAVELADTHESGRDRQDAIVRVFDHYLHTAHAACAVLQPARRLIDIAVAAAGVTVETLSDRDETLAWCVAEEAVLLAVVERAAELGSAIPVWQLPHLLSNVTLQGGSRDQWAAVQQVALTAAQRNGDIEAEAHLHRLQATALTLSGKHDQAATHLGSSVVLFGLLGDVLRQASVQHDLAYTTNELGRTEEALEHEWQALRLARACGDLTAQASTLNAIGWYDSLLGRHNDALSRCRMALTLFEHIGDVQGQAVTLDSIGHAHDQLGRPADAVRCYEQALEFFERIGQHFSRAETLVRLGDAHAVLDDAEAARQAWSAALAILDDQSHPGAEAIRVKLQEQRSMA